MSRIRPATKTFRWTVLLAGLVVVTAAFAATRNFTHPSSHDTSQQFAVDHVQRDDTPNDPAYDRAEPDDPDGPTSTNLFDERYDLFGFASQLTRQTAIYKAGPHQGQPQISGFNAAGAWKLTRGLPGVDIAILDTGIRWGEPGLRTQVALNTDELPLPQDAEGDTHTDAPLGGFDLNGNGAIDVDDYANDRRASDVNGNGVLDGGDLIEVFSDGVDDDANGFVDDIAGWDFFNDDNNPFDQSSYFAAENHGTGRALNAVERANDGQGGLGVCPECQFIPIRIWDTFVSDPNTFAMGILYATDNGAEVIEGANGSLGHTAFSEAASQYAYDHGVVQTYSGNDLNTGNHNFPANYGHTMLIQGVVADVEGLGTDLGQQAASALNQINNLVNDLTGGLVTLPLGTQLPVSTYFRSANTAQFGGHSSISMEGSTGSQNTGKAAGAAGLVISAARQAGIDLRPDEVRIILEQTAEDILAPNTLGVGIPDPAQPGWDIHFGYGRANLGAAVALAASGEIPPEAAIHEPDWYAPLVGDSVTITGLAGARFADGNNFHWELQWGVGLAPENFTTVSQGNASAPVSVFGQIDLNKVRAALAATTLPPDPAGPVFSLTAPHPFEQQFTVRLVVTGEGIATPGVDRRVFTAIDDETLRPGYPVRLGTGGEAPLRYADLNGDNVAELIIPGMDGLLRVRTRDGGSLSGFPVATQIQYQALAHMQAPGFAALADTAPPREILRGPAVADLDDDGIPEIIDTAGIHIYVWNADGTLVQGFPVSLNMDFCAGEDQRQPDIHRKCGFLGSPAIGHLEGPDAPPSIVAAGLDGHLYAFRPDGTPVPGFPVNLVDPDMPPEDQVLAESINSPAIGDLNGDGYDDVVIATNESYAAGQPSFDSFLAGGPAQLLADVLSQAAGGSSRVYAVSGKTGEFLPGWPIHLSGAIQKTLPMIGPGHNAALVEVNGQQAVVVSTTGGALGLYAPDGTLIRNMQQAVYGPLSNATGRLGQLNLFEYATVGDVNGDGTVDIVKYGLSLLGAANLLLVGQNFPYNHLIGAYAAGTGLPLSAWPVVTDDYQFLSASTIGKVVPGTSSQVLAGTGLGLVHAYDGVTGRDVAGFPKYTGGWLFAPPELSSDGRLAAITREGYLFEWNVPGAPVCQPEWPTFRHDMHNSGNYNHDARPPGSVRNLIAERAANGSVSVSWIAPGDDGLCAAGRADDYRIRVDGKPPQDTPAPGTAGSMDRITLTGLDGASAIVVQAVDEVGNVGYPVQTTLASAGGSDDGGGTGDNNPGDGNAGGGLLIDGGAGGCVLSPDKPFDPIWPSILLLALILAWRRRFSPSAWVTGSRSSSRPDP